MISIVNNGAIVGLCDAPRYVKVNDYGVYSETDAEDATHVAVGGVAYGLDETVVTEVDGGEIAFGHSEKILNVDADVADTQDALCILSEDVEARLADMEDALCEMSKEVE